MKLILLTLLLLAVVFAPIAISEPQKSALDQLRDAGPGIYLFVRSLDGSTMAARIVGADRVINVEPIEPESKPERAGGEA